MKTLDWINDADLLSRDYLSKIKGGNVAEPIDMLDEDTSPIDMLDDENEKYVGDSDTYTITSSN